MAVRSLCFQSVFDFQFLLHSSWNIKKKKEYMYPSMPALIDLVSGLFPWLEVKGHKQVAP